MGTAKTPKETTPSRAATWVSPVVTPGPETAALARFHWDCAWTGAIEPGMMGPGSPRMTAVGRARFTWTDDGLWLRGEFLQDQFAGERLVLTWKAHYLIGWDSSARDYVAFMADNCGHAGFMRGRIDRDRLVLESTDDGPAKFRVTWDLADPGGPSWIDEASVHGGPWQLIERYVMTPRASE